MKQCECGCGNFAKENRRFLSGHNGRGRITPKGENHHSYKNGHTEKITRWSTSVYLKDNFTCQSCFMKFQNSFLVAHHKKSREEYPELIYDVGNGISLCRKCHASLHTKGRISPMKGRKQSEEARSKISQSLQGIKRSEETIKRMRKANLGKTLSLEHRKKISLSKKGKIHSEETRIKISESMKLKWGQIKGRGKP